MEIVTPSLPASHTGGKTEEGDNYLVIPWKDENFYTTVVHKPQCASESLKVFTKFKYLDS